ncbi:hypothetical protein HDV03_005068 [Kappamyces sp. JEL0829]|nr:hypothetical protein HDV03_005068 [Kappamyces sp. JEL0829]
MASVVRMLYGPHPPFLALKSRKSLWNLIGHLPGYGVGRKVSPSQWYRQGRNLNYYQITQVSPPTKQVWGIRYRQGRPASPPYILAPGKFKTWGFFMDKHRVGALKGQLKGQSA